MDKVSRVSELIAAAAVVISLVFLGDQTRQNTIAIQTETYNAFLARGFELMLEPTRNELLLTAFNHFYDDRENIPYPYSTVLNSYIVTTFRLLESMYLTTDKHTNDPVSRTMFNNLLFEVLNSEHNRYWWEEFRIHRMEKFDEGFTIFINNWYSKHKIS